MAVEPTGRAFPARRIPLLVAGDRQFECVDFSKEKFPLGIQYVVLDLNQEDVMDVEIPTGVAIFTERQLEELRARGVLTSYSYSWLLNEGVKSSLKGTTVASRALLAKELESLQALGRVLTTQVATNVSQQTGVVTEMTTNDPKALIDQCQKMIEVVNSSGMPQAEAATAQALLTALKDLRTSLPSDAPFSTELNNFINVVNGGGDPTKILQNLTNKASGNGGFLGGNWGLNLQTLLALAGAASAVMKVIELAQKIDWVALASVLKNHSEALQSTQADGEQEQEHIETSGSQEVVLS